MATKRFLNVHYGVNKKEIDILGMERLGPVITAIKTYFGADIPGPAARIQLWNKSANENNTLIEDLDEIPDEYYLKTKSGGLSLTIVLLPSPTPSRQASEKSLVAGMGH